MSQVKIPYKSDKHRLVKEALLDRMTLSREKMATRYGDWKDMEERFLAYIPATTNDALRKSGKSAGNPQYATFEIPYSYAVALTAHTYWTSVFLTKNPILQYTARHGEAQNRVQAVEALMDYQMNVGRMVPALYTWLLDPTKYGFGVVGNYWDEEEVVVSEIVEEPETFLGTPIPGGKTIKRRVTNRVPGYTGNRLYNVRPQDFFPDPRVPLSQLQQGEFVGRYVEVSWNTILKRKQAGQYFNVEELERVRQAIHDREKGSEQITLPEGAEELPLGPPRIRGKREDKPYVALQEIYVELVPREWQLGDTEWPEKWVFTLAEEEVIIGARPMGLYHNQFPFFVQEYEPDGYSLFARSMMEVMGPMQDTLTWLINSHMHNVRKTLNDQFVVDPSKVIMKDLTDPNAGRLIRLKPEYYGSDPRLAVHQLQSVDVTQNHLRDVSVISDMIQRVTGVNDNIMGAVNQGGRKSATEVRSSTTFGINRLKTNAEYMSAMAWQPMASVLLANTQQFYDQEKQFKIAGDLNGPDGTFTEVTPEMIAGFYDYVPVDGTLPVDRFAQANLWRQFIADIGSNPQLAAGYDIRGIVAHMMQLAGAKNIKQFELKITPDELLQQQVQQGNSVPAGEVTDDMLQTMGNQVGNVGSTG